MTDPAQNSIPKSESWKMFNLISDKYDFLNRLLSLGMDKGWREQLVKYSPMKTNQTLLDLATGTGDVLITLMSQPGSQIVKSYGIDLAENMLVAARKKINQAGLAGKVILDSGDGHHLSFPDDQFDLVTIAFGIRNMENMVVVLKEIYRVLKRDSRLLVLEFSLPANPIIRAFHLLYLRYVIPSVGWLFSGNFKAYRYLSDTIEHIPYGEQFCRILKQVGFERVETHPICNGIATIYLADKINP